MPYGKFVNKELETIDKSYFLWLYEKLKTDSHIHMSLTNKMLKRYIEENIL